MKINKYLFLLSLTLISVNGFSQLSTNSPYSRFGLGNLSNSVSPEQSAIGGTSVVFCNSEIINSNNPATYSTFKSKSFLFSTSLNASVTDFQTKDLSQTESNTNFSNLSLGFPVNKYISVSSGLRPFSDIGYKLDYYDATSLDDTVVISSTGTGGLSNYYFGTSIKLHKTLSVGVNAKYIFGGLSRNRTADFNNSSIFNVSSVDRTNITGMSYEAGLLFNTNLSENKNVSFGLTYQNNSDLEAKRTLIGTTYELSNSSLIIKDTFQHSTELGTVTMPSKLSAGLMYFSEKWLLVANHSSQNWSEYQLKFDEVIEEDYLENSTCFSAGLQFTPDYNSVTQYWKKINYRIGSRMDKSYLNLNNNQISEKTLTLGLGFPVKRSNSYFNIAMEVGEKGTTEDNLIKEQFVRFNLGVTFKGIWFVKRKYD